MTKQEKTTLFILLTTIFAFVNGDMGDMIEYPVASLIVFSFWLLFGALFVYGERK